MLNMIGSVFIGATMVGSDQDAVNAVDAGGGTAHGESQVHGSLSMVASPSAAIQARTTVAAIRLSARYDLPSAAVATHSTVTADAIRSTLRGGTVHGSTSLSAAPLNLQERWKSGQASIIAGRSAVSGLRINLNPLALTGAVGTRTATFGNLINPAFFAATTIFTSTAVANPIPLIIHLLRGAVQTRTTTVAQVVNKGRFSGSLATGTTVVGSGLLRRLATFQAAVAANTTFVAGLRVYPEDFQDVRIRTSCTVLGSLGLHQTILATAVSPVHAVTVVTGSSSLRFPVQVSVITGHTVATAQARNGFGGSLTMRTHLHVLLGIQTGINSWRGSTIAGKTVAHAIVTTGMHGTAANGTFLRAILGRKTSISAQVSGSTTFHSHFGGRFAHEGPIGSVNLTALPYGDLGIPNEINCSSAPSADITVERSRILALSGNAGLAVDRELTVHGTAVGGNRTRTIGVPLVDIGQVATHGTLYA